MQGLQVREFKTNNKLEGIPSPDLINQSARAVKTGVAATRDLGKVWHFVPDSLTTQYDAKNISNVCVVDDAGQVIDEDMLAKLGTSGT